MGVVVRLKAATALKFQINLSKQYARKNNKIAVYLIDSVIPTDFVAVSGGKQVSLSTHLFALHDRGD